MRSIVDERIAAVTSLTSRKEEDDMQGIKKIVKTTLIVMAVVACVCGIAYALYKYLVPDYDDEFDDEFDDAFDDDDDLFADEDDDDDEDEEDKDKDEDKKED
ncbi:MAG: hypothetical protein IJ682_03100 [Lachnospiraceae bacterium]|nr:hypothetical protein [Lachnospiraceae bacterium]